MIGWRVLVVQDDSTFMRDELKLFMAYRDERGFSAVMPLALEMAEPIPEGILDTEIKPTIIPRELAEQIFTRLSYVLTGVADPHTEITRLRRELQNSQRNLTDLITALGRLGVKHEN